MTDRAPLGKSDVEVIARRVVRQEVKTVESRIEGLHSKLERIQATLTGANGDSFVTRLALLEGAISRLETALGPRQISEENSGVYTRDQLAKEEAGARKEENALKRTRVQGMWGFLGVAAVQGGLLIALMMDKC